MEAAGMAVAGFAGAAVAHDLAGDTLRMSRSDGRRTRLRFVPDGQVVFHGIMSRNVMSGRGTYTTGHPLCYDASFPGRERWTLDRPMALGRPVRAVSGDGRTEVTLRLRSGADTPIPPEAR